MADHARGLDVEFFAEPGQVLGDLQPAQPALVGVGVPMIAEIGDNDPVIAGKLPGDGMPDPGHETGGMEKDHGRPPAVINKVFDGRVADIHRFLNRFDVRQFFLLNPFLPHFRITDVDKGVFHFLLMASFHGGQFPEDALFRHIPGGLGQSGVKAHGLFLFFHGQGKGFGRLHLGGQGRRVHGLRQAVINGLSQGLNRGLALDGEQAAIDQILFGVAASGKMLEGIVPGLEPRPRS